MIGATIVVLFSSETLSTLNSEVALKLKTKLLSTEVSTLKVKFIAPELSIVKPSTAVVDSLSFCIIQLSPDLTPFAISNPLGKELPEIINCVISKPSG